MANKGEEASACSTSTCCLWPRPQGLRAPTKHSHVAAAQAADAKAVEDTRVRQRSGLLTSDGCSGNGGYQAGAWTGCGAFHYGA